MPCGRRRGRRGEHAAVCIDVQRPEVLVYEQRGGRLRLVAVEFFVDAAQWDAANAGPHRRSAPVIRTRVTAPARALRQADAQLQAALA